MNTYTETEALTQHLPRGDYTPTADHARACGVVSICLGCGTAVAVYTKDEQPYPDEHVSFEAYRAAYRDQLLSENPFYFDCCPDADTVLY